MSHDTPLRAGALLLPMLALLLPPETSGKVPVVEVRGDIDFKAVKCAACDFLVGHLDELCGKHEVARTVVTAVKRSKKRIKGDTVRVPWAESEMGWALAVEEACSFQVLRDLAYLTRSGNDYKLMNVSEMDPEMRDMAVSNKLTLDKDLSMYSQFESACESILDENPKQLVKLVRDAKRTAVQVHTLHSLGKSVGQKMVPTAGPETLRAAFCVDAVRACPPGRFPQAGKEKSPVGDSVDDRGDPVYGHAYDDP